MNENIKCNLCGSSMKKGREATNTGMGCLLFVVSFFLMFLFPVGTIVAFLLFLVALHYGSKTKGLWVCVSCSHKVDRKIKWYEFG